MRLENLRARMREKSLDAVFVTSELNQRYLFGYPFTDGLLVITADRAWMLTDFRYYEEAKKFGDNAFEVEMPQLRTAYVTELLSGAGVQVVGYEDKTVTVSEYRIMQERYPDLKFTALGGLLEELREIKDENEVANMAEAQRITDAAFSHILTVLSPDMTEADVALELEYTMRRMGADGLAFETIAVSGDASALPHGHPRNEKLHRGFLTMDFGAKYKGYCSDMTRTVVVGRADAEMKRLYETVLNAQTAAIAAIREGAMCATMDGIARGIIDNAGYAGCFGHGLGHAVGLYIHESPSLSARAGDRTLQAGQVVTVEPGIYLSGQYGCRIEDMVLVQKDGCRDFTESTKELIEIL